MLSLDTVDETRLLIDVLGDMVMDALAPDAGIFGGSSFPLPGAEMSWGDWLADVAPHINQSLMAPEHVALWEWIDGLERDERPPAFLADWPRGFGKTTTARLAMARLCVTLKRRFGLYVCATQVTANNHITSIRQRFESLGITRLEDKYGYSLGWNGERLRTANGFTLLALGLDQSNIRGLNLNDLRPDFIALDDIDDLHDSIDAADKKYSIITQTVIPAGSNDRAVLFLQNEIHANSVMHKFVSGEADALRRRVVSRTVAVRGFDCVLEPGKEGKDPEYRITDGESTWPGKSLGDWEADLNDLGESAFRRECLHELGAGGLFFRFQPTRTDLTTGEVKDWHLCPMPEVLPWHELWGDHDYGTGPAPSAACSHIIHADEYGVVTFIGEEYSPDRTSKQQALGLLLKLHELGFGGKPQAERDAKVPGGVRSLDIDGKEQKFPNRLKRVLFDHANTFPPRGATVQTAIQRQGEYPVEVWGRYGINTVPAVKDVIAGLDNLRWWLDRTVTYPDTHPNPRLRGVTVPAFRIVIGACPMLQGYLEKAMVDPADERLALAPARYEHAGDGGRYGMMARPKPSPGDPQNQPKKDSFELRAEQQLRKRGKAGRVNPLMVGTGAVRPR